MIIFRVILDRAHSPWDEALEKVDLSSHSCVGRTSEYITYIRERKMYVVYNEKI